VSALFLVASPLATAVIINFESFTPGVQPSGAAFMEAGFYIYIEPSNPGDVANIVNIGGVHGNVLEDSIPADDSGTAITISLPGGALFNLNSVDIANFTNPVILQPHFCGFSPRIEFTDNGPDCVHYEPGAGFTTVAPTGFQGISRLTVNLVSRTDRGWDFAVDNINVSPVDTDAAPEPSTILLVCTGFACAYCGRCKKLAVSRRRNR